MSYLMIKSRITSVINSNIEDVGFTEEQKRAIHDSIVKSLEICCEEIMDDRKFKKRVDEAMNYGY